MDVKLSSILLILLGVLTLSACQTLSKSTTLNKNAEELTFILLADIPDSDGDGVLADNHSDDKMRCTLDDIRWKVMATEI